MKQIIISEKDLIRENNKTQIENLAYLQMFYTDIRVNHIISAAINRVNKNNHITKHATDNIKYGLVRDVDIMQDQNSNWDGSEEVGNNPYEIINLDTYDIQTPESSTNSEQIVYVKDRVIVTYQLLAEIRGDNPKDKATLDEYCDKNILLPISVSDIIYQYKYSIYIDPILSTKRVVKISDIILTETRPRELGLIYDSEANGYMFEDRLSPYRLNNRIERLFIGITENVQQTRFNLNMLDGHEIRNLFVFIDPITRKPDLNRVIVQEQDKVSREDVICNLTRYLRRRGYPRKHLGHEWSENNQYIEIKVISQTEIQIKKYKNLGELSEGLSEQDKKQIVNYDDRRFGQKEPPYSSLRQINIGDEDIDNDTILDRLKIEDGFSSTMTYSDLRQDDIFKNIPDIDRIINNLQILFSGMDHVDNLGKIESVYKNLESLGGLLEKFVDHEDMKKYNKAIKRYKYYIYYDNLSRNESEIVNIKSKYLRDNELTLADRSKIIDQSVNTVSLDSLSYIDAVSIYKKVRSPICSETIIRIKQRILEPDYKHKNIQCLKESFEPQIMLRNMIVPDDVQKVLDEISNKYHEISVNPLSRHWKNI